MANRTVEIYITVLDRVERRIGKKLEEATKNDIEGFITEATKRMTSSTLRHLVITLKLYYRWLGKKEVTDNIPIPKKKLSVLVASDLITEEDIINVIKSCDNLRNKALIAILYDSACRNSEIRNIKIKDFVIESNKTGYVVVEGKTGKRQVPLSFSIPTILEWLNSHPDRNDENARVFFIRNRTKGKRLEMSTSMVREIVINVCKEAGIKKKVYPHLFRHSRITDLDKKGLSHTAMKHYAGWAKDSDMPSIYSHFSEQDIKDLIYQADGLVQPKIARKPILKPVICANCSTPNDQTNRFCFMCGVGLDEDSRKEIQIEEVVKTLIKTNPDIAKAIADKIKV